MKKVLLLLVIVQSMLFGYNYDDLLIRAQTALFPKILLLDKNLEKKLVDGKIVYLVAYEKNAPGTGSSPSELRRIAQCIASSARMLAAAAARSLFPKTGIAPA